MGVERQVADWVGGIGILLVALSALVVVAEIVGAAMLLRGSDVGRIMTIVFSVLSLFNIPIGTVIGAYSLWALTRARPQPVEATGTGRVDPAPSF